MRKVFMFTVVFLLIATAAVCAQSLIEGSAISVNDFMPAAVIGVAIATTSLFKHFAPEKIGAKLIWLPPIVVGIVGALLLTDPFVLKSVLWNAFSWAAGSAFIVLIVKRIGSSTKSDPPDPSIGS